MDYQKSFEDPMLGNLTSGSGPLYHNECQELLKEIQVKDRIIHELREKLKSIQEICTVVAASPLDSVCEHPEVVDPKLIKSFSVENEIPPHHSPSPVNTFRTPPISSDSESSVDGAKDDNYGFNLKLVKIETSPTIASIKQEVFDEEHHGSNSNSSFPSFVRPHHHQENGNEVSKITVQEIIDKVVERSPKRDDSLKTRNVEENICNSFNTLLSKLESQAERKERNQSEPWNGSSEDQSNSSNEQTFVNGPPPTTTASGSCMDLVLHSNFKRNLYSSCPTIPNTTATTNTTTTTEFSSLKAKPNNNMNEASNSSSFGLCDNSSRKRKSFAAASSSEQPSSSSSAALFPSSTNSNFHQPPPPAVGHHHHHFVYYPKSIPTFPYFSQPQLQQQVNNMESSSKSHHFLQCPKCSRSFSTQLTLLVHVKDCCQDVNVTPTGTPTPVFNFAVCCSSNSNNGIGGGGEPLPDQIPKTVLNRIPMGTDISMVYNNMHNNGNHTSVGGTTNAKSNYVRKC